ncbi:ABC transporter ATP-binding protein [Microbacterium esteraromaticum]|uniref:ABC transporter ATP-binding protein n=1 Tax=Microbacterium esteraromaticum TaxID=57043 RepID=A0A939DVV7_9MICO|nr:ABC transporter ATP-binding protein [Microbacterium esteraromaticum]MBN8205962.1 ABC transporter ATP-binding protein [Microbacterium esteraromaticum]MBN8416117.1 ABC transporter ATP-binding protein [Microbacterium esteraromaticum]MBN8423545.1 ABC transporter ATP-binding protein [Microbacterium esteraromaticum]
MRVQVEKLQARRGARTVVHGVSFDVASGSVLGLLGPNGSGKSSLLRAIAGIDAPAAGDVRFDGVSAHDLTRRQVAQRVAVMMQEHSEEFEIPVLELVLLGRIPHGSGFGRDSAADVAIALDALERVGAQHLASRAFSALSGGERQRVLFARALTQDTPVLVLDEPTNHLDIAHQLELLDLVRASGRTVLVALHDLNLAATHCDAVGVLAAGELVAFGSPDSILTPDLIRTVFAVESTAITHPATAQRHLLFDALARTPEHRASTRTVHP